ncbi:MAG: ARMT1-like domain-containing protein [Candidatus Omnitrophota bacterium]
MISKGQGNYETLAEENRPIFFIFKAKCHVVASHIGCRVGDIILKRK